MEAGDVMTTASRSSFFKFFAIAERLSEDDWPVNSIPRALIGDSGLAGWLSQIMSMALGSIASKLAPDFSAAFLKIHGRRLS